MASCGNRAKINTYRSKRRARSTEERTVEPRLSDRR
jgi:predicted RNA-binding Zn ribbon-like protein